MLRKVVGVPLGVATNHDQALRVYKSHYGVFVFRFKTEHHEIRRSLGTKCPLSLTYRALQLNLLVEELRMSRPKADISKTLLVSLIGFWIPLI